MVSPSRWTGGDYEVRLHRMQLTEAAVRVGLNSQVVFPPKDSDDCDGVGDLYP